MTEISEAAKAKVAELANAVSASGVQHWSAEGVDDALQRPPDVYPALTAFVRFIQQVSDAAKAVEADVGEHSFTAKTYLAPFILPEPVDPLQECLRETYGAAAPEFVAAMREALAKRGLKIVGACHDN